MKNKARTILSEQEKNKQTQEKSQRKGLRNTDAETHSLTHSEIP